MSGAAHNRASADAPLKEETSCSNMGRFWQLYDLHRTRKHLPSNVLLYRLATRAALQSQDIFRMLLVLKDIRDDSRVRYDRACWKTALATVNAAKRTAVSGVEAEAEAYTAARSAATATSANTAAQAKSRRAHYAGTAAMPAATRAAFDHRQALCRWLYDNAAGMSPERIDALLRILRYEMALIDANRSTSHQRQHQHRRQQSQHQREEEERGFSGSDLDSDPDPESSFASSFSSSPSASASASAAASASFVSEPLSTYRPLIKACAQFGGARGLQLAELYFQQLLQHPELKHEQEQGSLEQNQEQNQGNLETFSDLPHIQEYGKVLFWMIKAQVNSGRNAFNASRVWELKASFQRCERRSGGAGGSGTGSWGEGTGGVGGRVRSNASLFRLLLRAAFYERDVINALRLLDEIRQNSDIKFDLKCWKLALLTVQAASEAGPAWMPPSSDSKQSPHDSDGSGSNSSSGSGSGGSAGFQPIASSSDPKKENKLQVPSAQQDHAGLPEESSGVTAAVTQKLRSGRCDSKISSQQNHAPSPPPMPPKSSTSSLSALKLSKAQALALGHQLKREMAIATGIHK